MSFPALEPIITRSQDAIINRLAAFQTQQNRINAFQSEDAKVSWVCFNTSSFDVEAAISKVRNHQLIASVGVGVGVGIGNCVGSSCPYSCSKITSLRVLHYMLNIFCRINKTKEKNHVYEEDLYP